MAYVSRFTGQQIDEAIDEMHNNKVVCDLKKLDIENAEDGMLLVLSGGKFILGKPEDFGGDDGYTPQRGVDYYTDADVAAMVQSVLDALPRAEEESY